MGLRDFLFGDALERRAIDLMKAQRADLKAQKAVYTQGFSQDPPATGSRGNYLLGPEFDNERQNSLVYREIYEHSPWAATCIDAIANAGSKRFHLANAADKTKPVDLDTVAPILSFLNAPNEEDTFTSLLQKIYQDLLIRGSVFCEFRTTAAVAVNNPDLTTALQKALAPLGRFVPDVEQEVQDLIGSLAAKGIPSYLAVLPAEQMEVHTDKLGHITGYTQWVPEGGQIKFDPSEILRIYHPKSRSRTYGDSPMKPLLTVLTTDALIDRRQKKMLQNDVVLDTLFTVPNATSPDEVAAFSEQMMSQYRGQGSSGNFLVTTAEVNVQDISKSKEGDFLKQGQDNRDTILMKYGVPMSVAGDTSGTSSSYSAGSDNASRMFINNTVTPLAQHIEAALNRKLMSLYSNVGLNDYVLVFDLLDTDDTADVEITYDKMIRNGSKSINEVRQLRGEPPVEGGDVHWIDAKAPMTLETLENPPEPVAPIIHPPAPTSPAGDEQQKMTSHEVEKAVTELRGALRTLRKSF